MKITEEMRKAASACGKEYGKLGGRPAKKAPCHKCGREINARQRRLACPHKINAK